MGLDMYLTKKTFIGNKWRKRDGNMVDFKISLQSEEDKEPTPYFKVVPETIKSERIDYVEEEVMYWRKANAIHNWFVQHVQGGDDNCESWLVSKEDIEKLVDACKTILDSVTTVEGDCETGRVYSKDKGWETMTEKGRIIENTNVAEYHLPTQSGFFFGGTDYDEFYLQEVEETYKVLSQELKDNPNWYGDYYYRSSW